MTATDLRQLSNDELDTLAALRLGGGLACETPRRSARGLSTGGSSSTPGPTGGTGAHGRRPVVADRDAAAALVVERVIRRRGLEAAYVAALAEVVGGRAGQAPHDARGLFALVHASPRLRTIAAPVAAVAAGS